MRSLSFTRRRLVAADDPRQSGCASPAADAGDADAAPLTPE